MTDKIVITFEWIKIWTPNKYHIVPHSMTNHLEPNLSGLESA